MTTLKPFYLVHSIYRGVPFVHETDLDGTTREQLVEQLAQGQFDTGRLTSIIFVDLAAGTSSDVSQDIAVMLSSTSFKDEDELTDNVQAFVDGWGLESYQNPPTFTGFLSVRPHEHRYAA